MFWTLACFWLCFAVVDTVPEVDEPVVMYCMPTVGLDMKGLPTLEASCWFCSKIWFINSYFLVREAPDSSCFPALWFSIEERSF